MVPHPGVAVFPESRAAESQAGRVAAALVHIAEAWALLAPVLENTSAAWLTRSRHLSPAVRSWDRVRLGQARRATAVPG